MMGMAGIIPCSRIPRFRKWSVDVRRWDYSSHPRKKMTTASLSEFLSSLLELV